MSKASSTSRQTAGRKLFVEVICATFMVALWTEYFRNQLQVNQGDIPEYLHKSKLLLVVGLLSFFSVL